MSPRVTIGSTTFDHSYYDADADVLYLHVGEPRPAASSEETPEGHVMRFDEDGSLIGITIINARWLTDHRAHINLPDQPVTPGTIEPALASR